MNKLIPTITAAVIAGALALSGASAASAHPTSTPTPEVTSSSNIVTPPANTSEPEPLSTTVPTAFAASGQSSADPVSVPLTVKLSESSSPTPEPSESPASPPSEKPSEPLPLSSEKLSKSPVVSTPDSGAVAVPVLVLWQKPASTFGPQHLIASASTANLNALDADALPGHCYQADLYHPSETTSALIAGGVLNAPNSPHEDLLAGGNGVAYKTWCVPAVIVPTPVIPTPVLTATSSSTTDCIAKTVTTVTVTTTSNLFHLDGKTLVADKNIVTTKTASGTAITVECPVIVTPPVVTPPTVNLPTPVTAAVVQSTPVHQALAFTGPTPLAEATQLALALAGIILLIFGITMTIALRIRARRE